MLTTPDLESVARSSLPAEKTQIRFPEGTSIELRLCKTEKKYGVEAILPWCNHPLVLEQYASEQQARKGYAQCRDKLQQGCDIQITGRKTAKLVAS